jgi:hypothetical protein
VAFTAQRDTRDCTLVDFATRADLTGRLRGLVILLDDHLTADQARTADQLIDESEFGAALETLAGWLSENASPIPDDVRRDFERLSGQTGTADRVMGALEQCPREP